MQYCKLQVGCLIIVLYITYIYIREKILNKEYKREHLFEILLIACISSIIFDGITAYTVNHLAEIPIGVNRLLHLGFLLSLDTIVFLTFWYLLDMTRGIPERKSTRNLIRLPFIINVLVVICFIPKLRFCEGKMTNYSMGVSAYTCFIMVAVYVVSASGMLLYGFRNVGRRAQMTVFTSLAAVIGITGYQMIFPESLISCLVPTLVILGTYLNRENPIFMKLKEHHDEMVMGFAALVENRDNSTGQHIYRTTEYVKILADDLRKKGLYKETLTKDYIERLVTAAPLHDIGKIAIPDAILQKPGRLTAEEFEIMKTHAERGAQIIRETFGKEDEIAYEVAMYHHEKWNGKGYPKGISQREIPLCARIMAIADVFDAVSSKRCYKEAFPLSECFEIIKRGSGEDFDPIIVESFLECTAQIQLVYEGLHGLNTRKNKTNIKK